MTSPFRRVVTGHDDEGASIIVSDGPPSRVVQIGPPGPLFHEIWTTCEAPARIDRAREEPPWDDKLVLAPPKNGAIIRVLDLPPDTPEMLAIDAESARKHFEQIGAGQSSTHKGHPLAHRTETIDYGIVLEGELYLIVDKGETLLRAGDIVIQRGTNHSWSNRSGKTCRVAFILIDGVFDADLK